MIQLSAEGLDPLTIDDWEAGIACQVLDLGWPTTRSVVTDRPSASGTIDETRFFGARAVSVQLAVFAGTLGGRRALLDRLSAFCDPSRRPVLEFEDPTGGGARIVELRADQASLPLTNPNLTAVTVSWVAPSGLIQSAAQNLAIASPSQEAPGWTPPLEPPLEFPPFVGGPTLVVNAGSLPAEWTVDIYGPCTGPALTNRNSGATVSLPGLTIAAGDYLSINSAERTVLLNGLAGASRYSYLDFTALTWWQLGVGATLVDFTADSSAAPSAAWFRWRDTYL